MLDHIINHLEMAEAYAANASRIAALGCRAKHQFDLQNRCHEAAERERAEAAAHAQAFNIDALVVQQERATWRRLGQHSLHRAELLTVADLRWLRATCRHGRPGSRNVRRAAELLYRADKLLGDGRDDDPLASSTEPGNLHCARADGGRDAGDAPPQHAMGA